MNEPNTASVIAHDSDLVVKKILFTGEIADIYLVFNQVAGYYCHLIAIKWNKSKHLLDTKRIKELLTKIRNLQHQSLLKYFKVIEHVDLGILGIVMEQPEVINII
jgi:hypothetical protein